MYAWWYMEESMRRLLVDLDRERKTVAQEYRRLLGRNQEDRLRATYLKAYLWRRHTYQPQTVTLLVGLFNTLHTLFKSFERFRRHER